MVYSIMKTALTTIPVPLDIDDEDVVRMMAHLTVRFLFAYNWPAQLGKSKRVNQGRC
jgi:hypothetical protein